MGGRERRKKGYNKNQHSGPHPFPPPPHPGIWAQLGHQGSTCTGKNMLMAPKPTPLLPGASSPRDAPPGPFPIPPPRCGEEGDGPPRPGPAAPGAVFWGRNPSIWGRSSGSGPTGERRVWGNPGRELQGWGSLSSSQHTSEKLTFLPVHQ